MSREMVVIRISKVLRQKLKDNKERHETYDFIINQLFQIAKNKGYEIVE